MAEVKKDAGRRSALLIAAILGGAAFTLASCLFFAWQVSQELASLIPEVSIVTDAPEKMFDPSWNANGGTAKAKGLTKPEAERSVRVIREAMKPYPRLLLATSLTEVHCVSDLQLDGEDYLSSNQGDKIFILNRGAARDSDKDLARRLHYELARVLVYQKSEKFSGKAWQAAMPSGFSYDPDRLFPNWKAEDFDLREEKWLSQGVLNFAGVWAIGYDLGEIAEGMMTGSLDFYRHVKRHPALHRKASVLADFYRRLGIRLTLWESEIEGRKGQSP